ncbi:MAG: hypothetical protein VX994_01835 [Bacteroidota bacterium]|nr:hypothetical protein [Bacteroidota bacterium]
MRTKLNFTSSYSLISLFLFSTLFSCGSYQAVSYYASDGIYGGEVAVSKQVEKTKTYENGIYYKNYFSNVADDYSSLDNSQNHAYTDTDNYSSVNRDGDLHVNSQAPWGDRTTKTEIYYINNNPWGYFNWGFYNSFYDPFWSFNRFFNRGFYRPYWGLSFYDPFFTFGYGYFGYPLYGPRYSYRGYYRNRFDNNYAYSPYSRGSGRYSTYDTSRGGRSSQGYYSSNNSSNNTFRETNSDNNFSSTSRYNVGRISQRQTYGNKSGQKTTNRNTTSQTRQRTNNSNSRQTVTSRSNSYSSSSNQSSYNSRRSYGSSRSSYSSGGRSSSYSSGSRGSRSGGRSTSRGR